MELSTRRNDHHYEHVHDHTGITSCNDGHSHLHPGITSPPINDQGSHYHEIVGGTTYQDGHFHSYNTTSGSAIVLPSGDHTHRVSFLTSYDDRHRHTIEGYLTPVKSEMSY